MTAATYRRIVNAKVRKMRKHLPLPIHISLPFQNTIRNIALHEAAHIVVALAGSGEVLFAHIGSKLGAMRLNFGGKTGGLCGTYLANDDMGAFAVAGMVHDGVSSIGPGDAETLYNWLVHMIGPWPGRERTNASQLVRQATMHAKRTIRRYAPAVVAVANLLERKVSILDGHDIRRVARRACPDIPSASPSARLLMKYWRTALRDPNSAAVVNVEWTGFGGVLKEARSELAK